jgi:hypothetical protein
MQKLKALAQEFVLVFNPLTDGLAVVLAVALAGPRTGREPAQGPPGP